MDYLESYMKRIKGRLWMHMVGNTIMDDQKIGWDDKQAHLRNETIREHIFPFVSFSEFHANGYQMLKQYYIDLPYGRTFSFMQFLMDLWIKDRTTSIRNSWELAQDPVERARVTDMSDTQYREFMAEYFKTHHRAIPRSRDDFMRYAKVDKAQIGERISQAKRECRQKVKTLWRELGIVTRIRYRISSWIRGGKAMLASSLVIALIAVSFAESLKMIVIRLFDLFWAIK